MKRVFLVVSVLPVLAACAPAPSCPIIDRDAVEWTKFGTESEPGKCENYNAISSPIVNSRDVVPVGGPDNTTPDKQPERRTERDKPADKASGEMTGNPGNDKPVGRAGEKPEKQMDERSPAGNRGRSN